MATAFAAQTLIKPRWKLARQTADSFTAPYSAPPIPVLEIAERNGVDVVFADFGRSADKVAGFCDFNQAKLYVNADDPTNRQTFTIAHELGHWVLHRDFFQADPDKYDILPRFQKTDADSPFEKEANSFAANLLVPIRLLTPVKRAGAAALARVFAVSTEMMEYRLQNV